MVRALTMKMSLRSTGGLTGLLSSLGRDPMPGVRSQGLPHTELRSQRKRWKHGLSSVDSEMPQHNTVRCWAGHAHGVLDYRRASGWLPVDSHQHCMVTKECMCRCLSRSESGAWRGLRTRTKELEEFQAEGEPKGLVCSRCLEKKGVGGMVSCGRNCPGLVKEHMI